MAPTEEFETLREKAIEDLHREEVVSFYLGVINERDEDAYYFANDVEENELQGMAVTQLGMMTRVLADKSDLSVEEVADRARKRAENMGLQS
ncbi:MAG: hypothetical protein IH933_17055 [Euryarchaeota archaeon]|nr:hypothetical protein [Euryarchaeota archaeon]